MQDTYKQPVGSVDAGKLEMFVVYDNPKDFAGKFVVRVFRIGPNVVDAGPAIAVVDSLVRARRAIEDVRPDAVNIGRVPGDDPVIAEVWI